jgi:WD40 repeat protein
MHAGTRIDLSDRPTICSAADWDSREVVVGSSDHALYIIDVDKARLKRKLHGNSSGHAEWVTCVTYLGSGSILSGGIDSKLCLWCGARATDLQGARLHAARTKQASDLLISLFDLVGPASCVRLVMGVPEVIDQRYRRLLIAKHISFCLHPRSGCCVITCGPIGTAQRSRILDQQRCSLQVTLRPSHKCAMTATLTWHFQLHMTRPCGSGPVPATTEGAWQGMARPCSNCEATVAVTPFQVTDPAMLCSGTWEQGRPRGP